MNAASLDTTNLFLGVIAAVSVLEGIALIAAAVMAYRLYTQAMRTIHEIEERQLAPLVTKANALMAKVDAVLIDLKEVSARVTQRTERVDAAIQNTIDRVDETAGRVRSSVSARVNRVLSFVHAARTAIDSFFHNGRRPADDAPGHA